MQFQSLKTPRSFLKEKIKKRKLISHSEKKEVKNSIPLKTSNFAVKPLAF